MKSSKSNSNVNTPVITRVPVKGEMFFDQFRKIPADIVSISEKEVVVVRFRTYKSNRGFYLREIEWDSGCEWWTFKEEKKEYFVWVETVSSEMSSIRQGAWEKVTTVPVSQETGQAIEKLLKADNPRLEFATSSGKPSSFFI